MSSPAPVTFATRVAALLVLAWPVVLARSTQAIVGFTDALMSAPLGEDALAAVTAGAMNTFVVAILPMGVVFIVQSFAAQMAGEGDLAGARRYGWYGLMVAAATAVASAAALPLVAPTLGVLELEPGVRGLMSDYMVWRLAGMGAWIGTEALGAWFGGLGNTRLHMIAGIVAMVANIFLNWVLIYGHLGAPALGVVGAAVASSLAGWIGFAVIFVCFLRGWGAPAGARTAAGRLRRSEMWRVIRFGLPSGLNWFLEFAAFAVFINVSIAHFGTVVLAAMMVVINVNSVSFMPAFGVSSAGAILVGQAIGAGRHDDVPAIVRTTAIVTAAWQGAVGLLYLAIPATLIALFTPAGQRAEELLEVGTVLLALSAMWQMFDAVAMTMNETLRAAGDTAWSLYARVALAWAFFTPATLIGVFVLDGDHVVALLCI
ncbi:MAG TPA: MATE family efflux transporter, partial [Kofleriaceae bacterium]|nr:MATE family efflux transporter [Kofleriaceae bacterium]